MSNSKIIVFRQLFFVALFLKHGVTKVFKRIKKPWGS